MLQLGHLCCGRNVQLLIKKLYAIYMRSSIRDRDRKLHLESNAKFCAAVLRLLSRRKFRAQECAERELSLTIDATFVRIYFLLLYRQENATEI